MPPTTTHLNDIGLPNLLLKNFPHLAQMRQATLNAKAQVCIERARHITKNLKASETGNEPMPLRYARALNTFLSHKSPPIPGRESLGRHHHGQALWRATLS